MKYCSNCGVQNEDRVKFCSNCGQHIFNQINVQPVQSQNIQTQNWTTPPKKPLGTRSWFVILWLILFWPIGLYLMWKHKKEWLVAIKVIITIALAFLLIIEAVAFIGDMRETMSYIRDKNAVQMSESEYKASCRTIDYEEIARDSDALRGEYFVFSGKILQDAGDGYYRLGVTEGDLGLWASDVILFHYENSGDRILEDDMVTIWGRSRGLRCYESTIGKKITVPEIEAKYIEFGVAANLELFDSYDTIGNLKLPINSSWEKKNDSWYANDRSMLTAITSNEPEYVGLSDEELLSVLSETIYSDFMETDGYIRFGLVESNVETSDGIRGASFTYAIENEDYDTKMKAVIIAHNERAYLIQAQLTVHEEPSDLSECFDDLISAISFD